MESLGLKPSKTELQDIMNEIDVDQSGTISFDGKSVVALSERVSEVEVGLPLIFPKNSLR